MKITVYDKDYQRKGTLGAPSSVDFDIIANGAGTATIRIPAHRPRVGAALADGARVVIEVPGMETFSGKVTGRAGSGPVNDEIALTVTDDWRMFNRLLGWPVPTLPIGSQGVAYRKYTGTAEKILKDAAREAIIRVGEDAVVAPDLGRGKAIAGGIQMRFHPLADRLFPAVEQAGIIATVKQSGESGLVVDVREPKVVRRKFSVPSGNLAAWSWSDKNPTATSVVVGGQGEGEARTLMQKTDGSLEGRYGERVEAFVDARDTDEATELQGRIEETLTDGAPKSGLSLEIVNTKGFRYGAHYRVGDIVTVQAGPVEITDILRTVRFSWTAENGLTVAPSVGDRSDDPDIELGRTIREMRQSITNLKVR